MQSHPESIAIFAPLVQDDCSGIIGICTCDLQTMLFCCATLDPDIIANEVL